MHDGLDHMTMKGKVILWKENVWVESQVAASTVQTQTTTYQDHACSYLDIAVAYSNRVALCVKSPFSSWTMTSTTSAVDSSNNGRLSFLARHARTYLFISPTHRLPLSPHPD